MTSLQLQPVWLDDFCEDDNFLYFKPFASEPSLAVNERFNFLCFEQFSVICNIDRKRNIILIVPRYLATDIQIIIPVGSLGTFLKIFACRLTGSSPCVLRRLFLSSATIDCLFVYKFQSLQLSSSLWLFVCYLNFKLIWWITYLFVQFPNTARTLLPYMIPWNKIKYWIFYLSLFGTLLFKLYIQMKLYTTVYGELSWYVLVAKYPITPAVSLSMMIMDIYHFQAILS